ncbi:hypothetical protein BJF78_13740 [Pseudonocardia sp. CNS-139]|nr:hypothetical protein BJF78_13740 [Pseudonocardia sp. CNS-139]
MAGAPEATAAPAPAWALAFSIGVVVLLVAAAAGWVVAAVRTAPVREPAGAAATPQAATATAAVRTADPGSRPDRRFDPRLDACCHALMSLGMAGMLVAML